MLSSDDLMLSKSSIVAQFTDNFDLYSLKVFVRYLLIILVPILVVSNIFRIFVAYNN